MDTKLTLGSSPGQVVGINTNGNATAGNIGEFISATASGISLTSGNEVDVTSISLTAGDWDVSGTVSFVGASGTIFSLVQSSISITSVTLSGVNSGASTLMWITSGATTTQILGIPPVRISIAATTTVYLIGKAFFTVSTATGGGFISARRVR